MVKFTFFENREWQNVYFFTCQMASENECKARRAWISKIEHFIYTFDLYLCFTMPGGGANVLTYRQKPGTKDRLNLPANVWVGTS